MAQLSAALRKRLLAFPALLLASLAQAGAAQEPWTLTDDERRAFLHAYSPVILKQADEDGGERFLGHDWITHFDFDRDGNFSDNRKRWRKDKRDFVAGVDHPGWEIRPTLYTALLEFMRNGEKSLVLLYHVYHATQASFGTDDMHDWERMEVRLDGVRPGGPGQGELASYFVLTAHGEHAGRAAGHHDLRFFEWPEGQLPGSGKHLLVWQARWNGSRTLFSSPPRKSELRFVEDNTDEFFDRRAQVDISGHRGEKPFHYVFVDRDAPELAGAWDARSLTRELASELASGRGHAEVISSSQAPRITYELQDLADVFPTHYVHAYGSQRNKSWDGPRVRVHMLEGIRSDLLEPPVTVEPGVREFLVGTRHGKRRGYPRKHWFWGTYFWNATGNWTDVALARRSGVWNQHDYFLHTGVRAESDAHSRSVRADAERGAWLPVGWHRPEHGGFDGRWVSLFDG